MLQVQQDVLGVGYLQIQSDAVQQATNPWCMSWCCTVFGSAKHFGQQPIGTHQIAHRIAANIQRKVLSHGLNIPPVVHVVVLHCVESC
jgi:hypothetical protein